MASVFVTGASGYVGRHVVREFLERGDSVAGLARSDSAAQSVVALGASTVRGDLERPESYEAAAVAADVIVHAGFSYSEAGEENHDVDRTAVDALLRYAAADGRPRRFIYTASVFRYAPATGEYATELDAVPRDPADWRHVVGEQVLAASTPTLKTAVIRLGWVYGSDGGTLGEAIAPLAGKSISGEVAGNRVPLIDVLDLARLYADVARSEGGVFHGCGGRPITIGELAAIATEISSRPATSSPGAQEHFSSIFRRDTPAISIHQPVAHDLAARVMSALKAGAERGS